MKCLGLAVYVWLLRVDPALPLRLRTPQVSNFVGEEVIMSTTTTTTTTTDANALVVPAVSSSSSTKNHGEPRVLSSTPSVKKVGNDGSPSKAFPLGLCEGDCDNDYECAGSLVCFQRHGNEAVPGCSGGSSDSSGTDYCIESTTLGTSGGVTSADFILKLYWQKGYTWQDDRNEVKWCLKCMGSKCDPGDLMVVVYCDTDNPTPLEWVDFNSGSEFMIKIGGSQASSDLCFELNTNTRNYELQSCDEGDDLQRFFSGNGTHDGTGMFEIHPKTKPLFCLTQRHEPKYGEQVRAETCITARKSHTSFWNKYV